MRAPSATVELRDSGLLALGPERRAFVQPGVVTRFPRESLFLYGSHSVQTHPDGLVNCSHLNLVSRFYKHLAGKLGSNLATCNINTYEIIVQVFT